MSTLAEYSYAGYTVEKKFLKLGINVDWKIKANRLNTVVKDNSNKILLGGGAVTTPTFQLGGAGSTPGRDI